MAILIQPYCQEHESAVDGFNGRLQQGGAEPNLVFFRWAVPRWLPRCQNRKIFNEFFVAVDGDIVRGGYALKHQDFFFSDGSVRTIGYYHHPLSEGIIDKRHAIIGTLLLRDAINRSPRLYCLGMGGYDRPLPKMLLRLGWAHALLPLYFRVMRPARFLRQMRAASFVRRFLMNLGAFSGAGWAVLKVFNGFHRLRSRGVPVYSVEPVQEFDVWTDSLWERCKGAYSLTAVRDCATLRTLYPASDQHLTRLRIRSGGTDIGWAVVGERRKDPKYGSMRVGSIIDCWACPENVLSVVLAASEVLADLGVDLILSNQSHEAWCHAFASAGFLRGQSNFVFAASRQFVELLQPFEQTIRHMHFTRADGDGLPRNF